MHTEEEAKKLWCPMVRFAQLEGVQTSNRGSHGGIPSEDFLCRASGCAMWRWGEPPRETMRAYHADGGKTSFVQAGWTYSHTDTDRQGRKFDLMHRLSDDSVHPKYGYCGLAGRPE